MNGATREINVGQLERLASATVGGLLLANGLRRRSLGGVAIAVTGGDLLYRGLSGHCQVYQGLGVSTAKHGGKADLSEVERSITIGKPADELYRLWREPESLSRVMGPLAEVTALGENRFHWRVNGPLGRTIGWDTEIVEDRPGELLRWQSTEGTKWRNEGSVRFLTAPQDWGTQVTLRIRFDPPGGALGDAIVKHLGFVPRTLADKALHRFKSLAETGEIATLDHNPSGRTSAFAH